MADTTWFRVELDGSGERFAEFEMSPEEFEAAVEKGAIVRPLRQVIAIPMRTDDGKTSISFAPVEKFSPLVAGCIPETERLSLGRVATFAQVDTSSEMWQYVKEGALGEPGIVTPHRGIVTP